MRVVAIALGCGYRLDVSTSDEVTVDGFKIVYQLVDSDCPCHLLSGAGAGSEVGIENALRDDGTSERLAAL